MKHVGGRNVTLVIVIVFQNQPPKRAILDSEFPIIIYIYFTCRLEHLANNLDFFF